LLGDALFVGCVDLNWAGSSVSSASLAAAKDFECEALLVLLLGCLSSLVVVVGRPLSLSLWWLVLIWWLERFEGEEI